MATMTEINPAATSSAMAVDGKDMMSSSSPSILASWYTYDGPLPAGIDWDGHHWSEKQTWRASNDTQLQAPVGEMNAIRFVITNVSGSNIDGIRFGVSIDLPGPDLAVWQDLQNNSVVSLASKLASLNITLDEANQRGFYIGGVQGAFDPFTVTAEATHQ
jgi:hypothetical protein